jgi:hypothetical protein
MLSKPESNDFQGNKTPWHRLVKALPGQSYEPL